MDTIEITLPISGKVVEIRNYTTKADDRKARDILTRGVEAEGGKQTGKPSMKFPISNVFESQESYIPRLVQTIDGDSMNIQAQLEELRSEDYEAVEAAVEKIVSEHSPKAREAKHASDNGTTDK